MKNSPPPWTPGWNRPADDWNIYAVCARNPPPHIDAGRVLGAVEPSGIVALPWRAIAGDAVRCFASEGKAIDWVVAHDKVAT